MPKKPLVVFAAFFAFYLLLIFPLSPYRRDATITDIIITNHAHNVTVFARVQNCFTKKMQSAILAGVPTTFTFFLELYQERKYWIDMRVASIIVKQTIKYDNVKKIFYVSSEGDHQQTVFQDFNSAKRAMADINGIAVASLADLQRDETYYVMIKAKLDTIRLPMHMEYILFFVSLWDFETDWYRQKVIL
ncbi:MAG: DUF4390 domain-containing protein [Deltaproteobacteria bacterium]|nr:DUF4390 domain-containing protein [Deltaproteobacteria bacterium]